MSFSPQRPLCQMVACVNSVKCCVAHMRRLLFFSEKKVSGSRNFASCFCLALLHQRLAFLPSNADDPVFWLLQDAHKEGNGNFFL